MNSWMSLLRSTSIFCEAKRRRNKVPRPIQSAPSRRGHLASSCSPRPSRRTWAYQTPSHCTRMPPAPPARRLSQPELHPDLGRRGCAGQGWMLHRGLCFQQPRQRSWERGVGTALFNSQSEQCPPPPIPPPHTLHRWTVPRAKYALQLQEKRQHSWASLHGRSLSLALPRASLFLLPPDQGSAPPRPAS